MNAQVRYLLASAVKWAAGRDTACPSCGGGSNPVVSRKYLITALRRCGTCKLLYRTPTSTDKESKRYYQTEYRSGLTTEMPGPERLKTLLNCGFSGSGKDFGRYIRILRALGIGQGARVIDFGASWGYGTWQFAQAGYRPVGFEVSVPRARFATEQLGVEVVSDMNQLPSSVDAFFSSHVMEHIPALANTLDRALATLRPGGLFVAITPNGSLHYRKCRPGAWQRSWGLKHPNLIDEVFYRAAFGGRPCLITTELGDFDRMARWSADGGNYEGTLDGWELLVACRMTTTQGAICPTE